MAAPDSIAQSLGFLSPMERASNDYSRILQTLQLQQNQQQTNAKVADLGFNLPVYQSLQASQGYPGQGKPMLPDLNSAATPDSDLGAIMGSPGDGIGGASVLPSNSPGVGSTPGMGQAPVVAGPTSPPKESDTYLRAMTYYGQQAQQGVPGASNHFMVAKGLYAKALKMEDDQRRKNDKEDADSEHTRTETRAANLKFSQMDNPVKEDFREARQMDGSIKYYQRIRKNGIDIGEKEVGRGIVMAFNNNNNSNRDLTNAQRGDEAIKVRDTLKSSSMVNEMVGRLQGQLNDPDTKTGFAGKGVEILDSALSGVSQVLGISGQSKLDNSAQAWAKTELPSAWQSIATKTAINQADYTSLVMTYATVKAFGGSGGALTEKDIKRAATEVGAGLTNKDVMKRILDEIRDKNNLNMEIGYRNILDPEAKRLVSPLYEDYKTRYATSPSAPTTEPYSDAEKEARYQKWRKDHPMEQ